MGKRMMRDIEEVKKILWGVLSTAVTIEARKSPRAEVERYIDETSRQICQLFEQQPDSGRLLTDEEITRHELPDGDYDITGLCQAQLAKGEARKEAEIRGIFEELDSDCPHRTMANLDGEGDVSLRKKRECPRCIEELKARYSPTKEE